MLDKTNTSMQHQDTVPQTTSSYDRQPTAPGKSSFDHILAKALPYSFTKTYARGSQISLDLDTGHVLCYVKKGAVEVSYKKFDQKNVAALITRGHFIGEIGFFDHGSRSRELRALEETELSIFNEDTLTQLQREAPEIYCHFLTHITKLICSKFRRILDERQLLTTYGASLAPNRKHFDTCRRPLSDQFLLSEEWRQVYKVAEDFKRIYFNITHDLQKNPDSTIPDHLQTASDQAIAWLSQELAILEASIGNSPHRERAWGYLFKETFPFLMRSRYGERIYYKPKGYAGDFLMIEHLYQNKAAGDGKIGRMIDQSMLRAPASRAVRGRRRLLAEQLRLHTATFPEQDDPIRIMNLACGANRELFDFLSECPFTSRIEALCIDIDTDALDFTNRHVNVFPHEAAIKLVTDNVVKWALGRNRHHYALQNIIYSAGLIDYLDRRLVLRLINRCFQQLKPGGILILGNYAPVNPNRYLMEYLFHWSLVYRDAENLKELFKESAFRGNIEIIAEEQGINLFAVAKKQIVS